MESLKTRRSFLNGLLGMSILGFFGSGLYAVARFLFPPASERSGEQVVKVALKKDVPSGKSLKFRFGRYPAILINYNGTYYAYGAICTHLGCIAHYRDERGCTMDMPEQEIHCVCHAGHYDLKTGPVISGPPPSPLPKLKLEERGEEIVAVAWENPDYIKSLATYK